MILHPEDGVAIVTGGGSGLGRALVLRLCDKGFQVFAIGRGETALQETVALSAGRAIAVPLDIADAKAVRSRFAEITEAHGPIALLINNAAVYPHRDLLDETSESFFATHDINFGGVLSCSLAALSSMTKQGRGRILNVATFAGDAPLPGASAYSVSKGAARLMTRAMIADLEDRFPDIVINEWMPGMLNTQMGIPEGIAPGQAAIWGTELAIQMDRTFTGSTFEMDIEILPPRGLKGKIKDRILRRTRKPRQLSGLK